MSLLLFGVALLLFKDKILTSRKVMYFTVVSVIFAFSLYGHIGLKVKSLTKLYRNEVSVYNNRMDVYLDKKIVAHLDKIKAAIGDYIGQEALIIDSYYAQQVFYFIFNLKPAVPYVDFDKQFVEEELAYHIIKTIEKKNTRLAILNEDDYKQIATENYWNLNLIPLYKYIKENYKLKQIIQSTPELEKQQLRGCAIMFYSGRN